MEAWSPMTASASAAAQRTYRSESASSLAISPTAVLSLNAPRATAEYCRVNGSGAARLCLKSLATVSSREAIKAHAARLRS